MCVGRSSGQMLGLMNHPIEDDLQVVKAGQVAGLTDHLVDGSLQTDLQVVKARQVAGLIDHLVDGGLQTKRDGHVVGLVDPANDGLHA